MIEYGKNELFLSILLLIVFAVPLITAVGIRALKPFFKRRNDIKCEMARACDESEYRHWKSKLRKLYISYIPVVGKSLAKRMR